MKRTLALIAVAAIVSACGGDTGGTTGVQPPPVTNAQPTGNYDISSINAKSLPVAIFADTGGYTYEVTSGTLALTSDGKYSAKINYRQTLVGKVDLFTDSTGGTWVLSGTQVTFTNGSDASTDKAEWASATGKLTFVETEGAASNTYVYTKK